MEYVVIRSGGKQYRASKGDILEVDKITDEENGQLVIDDVLLWVSDGQVKIGKPKISDIRVKAKILEQKKGKKIRVAKFQSKVRLRRVTGFRAKLTKLQIEEIEATKVKVK